MLFSSFFFLRRLWPRGLQKTIINGFRTIFICFVSYCVLRILLFMVINCVNCNDICVLKTILSSTVLFAFTPRRKRLLCRRSCFEILGQQKNKIICLRQHKYCYVFAFFKVQLFTKKNCISRHFYYTVSDVLRCLHCSKYNIERKLYYECYLCKK